MRALISPSHWFELIAARWYSILSVFFFLFRFQGVGNSRLVVFVLGPFLFAISSSGVGCLREYCVFLATQNQEYIYCNIIC